MLKKLILALAALGLTAGSVPAIAQPRVDFEVRVGTRGPDYRDNRRFNKRYYQNHRHYRNVPRCNRWEVAVRNPYRYNRYVCIDRDDYRRHGPRYRY